jgi:uncharacterized damage-inducible protein DinB
MPAGGCTIVSLFKHTKMKKLLLCLLLFTGLAAYSQTSAVSVTQISNAKTAFGKDMVEIMQHQKSYTLEIAELMPEDKYNYKPTEGVRTFSEHFKHISIIMNKQTNFFLKNIPIEVQSFVNDLQEYEKKSLSKKEIITQLTKEFDDAIKRFESITDAELNIRYELPFPGNPGASLRTWCMGLRDHITHQRGQAIIYLRMNGIKAPQYFPF